MVSTADAAEITQFSNLADQWWNESGPFRPLHQINPLRIEWILQEAAIALPLASAPTPLKGVKLLDIGCGGGLVAEPLARLGAEVMAIDASEKNIAAAQAHAKDMRLEIDYRSILAETLAEEMPERFDIVLALEIIEHVADVDLFLASAAKLLKPGGLLVITTLNRTAKSYAFAIIGAEYVLNWLPRGTHDWKKFIKPSELAGYFAPHSLALQSLTGMSYSPLSRNWQLNPHDVKINYLMSARKAG